MEEKKSGVLVVKWNKCLRKKEWLIVLIVVKRLGNMRIENWFSYVEVVG